MGIVDFGWYDVLSVANGVNINGGPWSLVMNQDTWNSLPPDVQQVFTDLIPWVTELNDKVQYNNEQIGITTLTEHGMVINQLSQEELDRWAAVDTPAMESYLAEFVNSRGMPGDELKNEYLRLHQKYAAPEYKFD
jgi:TRAP-type C4-dicarboxylate transport system substrate-binding protein